MFFLSNASNKVLGRRNTVGEKETWGLKKYNCSASAKYEKRWGSNLSTTMCFFLMQLMICDSDKHLPKCFPSKELYCCSGNSPPLCIQSKKPIIVFFLQISEFCLEVGHSIIEKQHLHHSSLQTPKSRELLYIFCAMLYLSISCHAMAAMESSVKLPGIRAQQLPNFQLWPPRSLILSWPHAQLDWAMQVPTPPARISSYVQQCPVSLL